MYGTGALLQGQRQWRSQGQQQLAERRQRRHGRGRAVWRHGHRRVQAHGYAGVKEQRLNARQGDISGAIHCDTDLLYIQGCFGQLLQGWC